MRVYCILQYALKFFKKIMLKIGEYARIREINKLEFEVEINVLTFKGLYPVNMKME